MQCLVKPVLISHARSLRPCFQMGISFQDNQNATTRQPNFGYTARTLTARHQKMNARKLLLIALLPVFTTLSACGVWWLPRAHKIDIQQGNLLSAEAVSQVTIGMSKGQVIDLLGRPLTSNQLNPERWEFIYSNNRSGEKPKVKRLSLEFKNEIVADLDVEGW